MTNVVPALLVQSKEEFEEKIHDTEVRELPLWQIDVLDGSMYDADSWADFEAVSEMKGLPDFELHLMIQNPIPVVKSWVDHVDNVKRAIIHAEIDNPLQDTLTAVKEMGLEAGLAIGPGVSIEDIGDLREYMDLLLIMGIHPGKSGQKFLGESILSKIAEARHRWPDLPIAIDGGVNEKNAEAMVAVGATQLSVASAIWKSDNIKETIKHLQK